MKKHLFALFVALLPILSSAYEGVLEYKINSADRDWKMVCYVKGDLFRGEIYLGSTLFQTVMRNEEGILLLDELNKQVFLADFEREKWGRQGEPLYKDKKKGKYQEGDAFQKEGYTGKTYQMKHNRRTYLIDLVEGYGSMPWVVFDQFKSLRGMRYDGEELLTENPGVPYKIYRKKKEKSPLLIMTSQKPQPVDESIFVVGESYIRAKMRFKMR